MASDRDNDRLRAELDALRTERGAALLALERIERESEERSRLLTEEQDRFVSRLLEGHDREQGRLRLELDEAKTTVERMERKLERQRESTERLEDQMASLRTELDRVRREREASRTEHQRTHQEVQALQTAASHLRMELDLARAMLGDAMGGSTGFSDVPTERKVHEVSHPPRESGILTRNRAGVRARKSTPPARPRAASGGSGSDAPPSSR